MRRYGQPAAIMLVLAAIVTAGIAVPARAAPSVAITLPAKVALNTEFVVTYAGTADDSAGTPSMVVRPFYQRNPGPCGTTSAEQLARADVLSEGVIWIPEGGPFSENSRLALTTPGFYRFCAYLEFGLDGQARAPEAFATGVVEAGKVGNLCRVPQVTGLSLAAATGRLQAANCNRGTVRRPKNPRRRALVVRSQSQPAGATLALGAKVNLVLRIRPAKG